MKLKQYHLIAENVCVAFCIFYLTLGDHPVSLFDRKLPHTNVLVAACGAGRC